MRAVADIGAFLQSKPLPSSTIPRLPPRRPRSSSVPRRCHHRKCLIKKHLQVLTSPGFPARPGQTRYANKRLLRLFLVHCLLSRLTSRTPTRPSYRTPARSSRPHPRRPSSPPTYYSGLGISAGLNSSLAVSSPPSVSVSSLSAKSSAVSRSSATAAGTRRLTIK